MHVHLKSLQAHVKQATLYFDSLVVRIKTQTLQQHLHSECNDLEQVYHKFLEQGQTSMDIEYMFQMTGLSLCKQEESLHSCSTVTGFVS